MQQRNSAPEGRQRAYSILDIKEVNGEGAKRTFKGIASTPSVDRMGDIVEPLGMEIKLPAPLLWQHNSREPVGWVHSAKATKDGIFVECEIATIKEDGELKNEIDKRWQQLTNKLVRGLSIGFDPIEHSQIDGSWGYRFIKWELLELSCVTIPANSDCSIETIKSYSHEALARLHNGSVFLKSMRTRPFKPAPSDPQKHAGAVYLSRPK